MKFIVIFALIASTSTIKVDPVDGAVNPNAYKAPDLSASMTGGAKDPVDGAVRDPHDGAVNPPPRSIYHCDNDNYMSIRRCRDSSECGGGDGDMCVFPSKSLSRPPPINMTPNAVEPPSMDPQPS